MLLKWEILYRGFPPLLSKSSWGFTANPIQQGPTRKRCPAVGRARRHGQASCHSKALKVLTSSSYRCLLYTHYKSVYCDWPHLICWCCKALMVPNKGGRLLTARFLKWGRIEGDQEGEREMMSWTIKHHNGKPPSATSSSGVLCPESWCYTQSPNNDWSELKGPTHSFARIPQKWFAQGLLCSIVVQVSWILVPASHFLAQGPSG